MSSWVNVKIIPKWINKREKKLNIERYLLLIDGGAIFKFPSKILENNFHNVLNSA